RACLRKFGVSVLAKQVPAMRLRAVCAGHIPSAPAFVEGRAMVHQGNSAVLVYNSLLIGHKGAHNMAWYSHGLGGGVAFEALVIANEARVRLRLFHDVKNR